MRSIPLPLRPVVTALALVLGAASASAQSENVTQVGHFSNGAEYTDVEGYDAPDGTALAIIGTNGSTVFVDVTDPAAPVQVGEIRGPTSGWREMEVYRDYCYVVNESRGGLQVIDLTNPRDPQLVGNFEGSFQTGHTVSVDAGTGVLYVSGSNIGTAIFNLEPNPAQPQFVTTFGEYYIHDLYAENGRVYAGAIQGDFLGILDVSNLPAIAELSRTKYPGGDTHNAWLTENGRYCLTTDERGGGHIHVFDVSNPVKPTLVGEFAHPENPFSSVHNVTIRDGYAYVAWYTEGLQVLDLEDPSRPVRAGYFLTTPGTGLFDGAWGVHPFTRSGLIYVSDRQTGLHVLEFDGRLAQVAISVFDSEGHALAGIEVRLPELGRTFTTNDNGEVHIRLPEGTHVVRIDAFGYELFEREVTVVLGEQTGVEARLQSRPSGSIHGIVHTLGGGPVDSGVVLLEGTPLSTLVDASGAFGFPRVPPGEYRLRATRFGARGLSEATTVTVGAASEIQLRVLPALFADDFEGDQGWQAGVPNDAATLGLWVRGDPNGTQAGSVQPEDDASPAGTTAFVTGNLEDADIGDDDVDAGATTLVSPAIDLSGTTQPILSFARWFSNDQGPSVDDALVTEVSSDGGASWAVVEALEVSVPEWTRVEIPLAPNITPTNQVLVRFVASDLHGASVVEAGIDDVEIVEPLGVVAGTVLESGSGLPIANAEITIGPPSLAGAISRHTDEQGDFEFLLPAGHVELTVVDYRYVTAVRSLSVLPLSIAREEIALTKKPVSPLEGRILSDGAPLVGASVGIVGTPFSDTSALDGSFRFPEVPIGSYRVTAAREGFESADVEVTVSEANNAPLSLTLRAQFESELLFAGPNPVRGDASVSLRLARAGLVTIDLVDAGGRRVAAIWDGELPAGESSVPWNPGSVADREVPQGLYFQRIQLAGKTYTKRVVVLR